MAVDAIDLDSRARFTVELAITVAILLEVAIHAVHPFFEMNVAKMDGFLEAIRIFEANRLVFRIEPRPLAIVLVDGAIHPPMTVEVRELRLSQFGIER